MSEQPRPSDVGRFGEVADLALEVSKRCASVVAGFGAFESASDAEGREAARASVRRALAELLDYADALRGMRHALLPRPEPTAGRVSAIDYSRAHRRPYRPDEATP